MQGEVAPKGTEGVYAAEFLYIPRRGTVGARHASPARISYAELAWRKAFSLREKVSRALARDGCGAVEAANVVQSLASLSEGGGTPIGVPEGVSYP